MKPAQCVYWIECKRPALPDPKAQGYCILHALWDDKDLNVFQAAIDEIIQNAEKSKVCDFSYCYFPFNYDCKNLRKAFEFDCYFARATFSGDAIFWGAEFSGDAVFDRAKFSGAADFLEAEFSRDAVFWGAEFSGRALFKQAKFSRDAVFWGAEFSGAAVFERAKFSERAEFSGDALFRGATFSQSANFSYVETSKTASVWFYNVNCLKPQRVRFHHVDLSRWSFLDTDLRRIDLDNVTWSTIPTIMSALQKRQQVRRWEKRHLPRHWLLQLLRLRLKLTPRRTALFDELNVPDKKENLARVERLYRHLKQNYENQRDYSRAGDFYYGEMEMKRRQQSKLGQIPFLLYRFLSDYGENYRRALVVLIGMWVAFAVLFTFCGYTDKEMGLSVQRFWTWNPSALGETLADFARSLIYSAQSMTLFHEPNITFKSIGGKWVELIASILGVIQIALFGLALQRQFKR